MRRNTVREFLKLAGQPGVISFAGGLPAAELFPREEIGRAAETVFTRIGTKALQYGETEGIQELRAWIADKHGTGIDSVLITNGAQQALDMIGKVLIDTGDHIAVENPTYLALLSAWRPLEPIFQAVLSDIDGLIPESLPEATKLLYLVPNFQNPAGYTLSLERRLLLAAMAQRDQLIIVEDDPYGELRYEGESLPSIFSLAGAQHGPVIHVGSFSKILAPGLRIGWIVASPELIERLVLAKQAMDLHTSTTNQWISFELASSRFLDRHIPGLRLAYRNRRDTMLESLYRFMPPNVHWTRPSGGMFLLLTLPKNVDAAALARQCLKKGVLVVPGRDFHVRGGENTLRLNFSAPSEERIREGVEKLGEITGQFCSAPPAGTTRLAYRL
jgi:2-aminoadipate transaminase